MATGDGGMIGNGFRIGYRQPADSPVGAWIEVGQVIEGDGLDLNTNIVDSDVHAQHRFVREMPGKIKVSPMKLTLLANPTVNAGEGTIQAALAALQLSGETVQWRAENPAVRDQTTVLGREWDGWVASFNRKQPRMEGQVVEVSIVFDGTTFAEDAAPGATQFT